MVILGKSAHGRERIQKIKASYGSVDLHYRLLAKRPLLQYAPKNHFAYTIEAEKKAAENEKQTMSSLLVLPQSLPPLYSSTND